MASNEGSSYTLLMNSEFESEEWELNEAWGPEDEAEQLSRKSSPVIESPFDSQPQNVEAIELDHVYHRKSSDASETLTECRPESPDNPTSVPALLGPSDSEPMDDLINSPMDCMSLIESTTGLDLLHMDLGPIELDNYRHEHNGNNETQCPPQLSDPETAFDLVSSPVGSTCMSPTESFNSLQMDLDPVEPDSGCHEHKSDSEKDLKREGPENLKAETCQDQDVADEQSGPAIADKLPIFGCKRCGSYFGSETVLGNHQDICKGIFNCKPCLVTFAYKDAIANLIPTTFVCKDCGLSFSSDCGVHKGTDELSLFEACTCHDDAIAKLAGHDKACKMSGVSLQSPSIRNTCKCTKNRNETSNKGYIKRYTGEAKKSGGNTAAEPDGINLLDSVWALAFVKCCKCNIMFKTTHNLFLHLTKRDGKLQCGNVADGKPHSCLVRSYPCLTSTPPTRYQKLAEPGLVSGKSTNRLKQIHVPRNKSVRVRDRIVLQEDHSYSRGSALCEICGKFFADHWGLQKHASEHILVRSDVSPLQKYTCTYCDYIAKDKTSLRNHQNLHILGTDLVCVWCGTLFLQRETLKQHKCDMKHVRVLKSVPQNQQKICVQNVGNIAQEAENTLQNGKEPKLLLDDKPTCTYCDYIAKDRTSLKNHQKLHTQSLKQDKCSMRSDPYIGTKPYLCEYCGCSFLQEYTFTVHMATHGCMDPEAYGITPVHKSFNMDAFTPEIIRCQICDREFDSKSQLLRHKNLHRGESRRTVSKRKQADPDSSNESSESAAKKQKSEVEGSIRHEKLEWTFTIYGTDGEPIGKRRSQKQGPTSAPKCKWAIKSPLEEADECLDCSMCGKKFPRPCTLRKHIKVKHSGFYCDKCDGLGFSSRSELNDHLRTHSDCSMCGKNFINPLNLKKHITTKHSGFYCDKCDGLGFSSRSELNDHLLTHSEQSKSVRPEAQGPKLSASKCKQSINSPSDAADVCVTCSLCFRRFSRPLYLKKHVTIKHSGLYCDKCDGLAFSSRADLNNHLLTHTCSEQSKVVRPEAQGPKLSASKCKQSIKSPSCAAGECLDCSMCGNRFSNPSNLKKHITFVHSGLYCDKCDGLAPFSSRADLNNHFLTHTRSEQSKVVRPEAQGPKLSASKCKQSIKSPSWAAGECLDCSMCGKNFINPLNLKKHIKFKHSGFYCDKCDGLGFSSRSELNNHLLTHSDLSKSVGQKEQGLKLYKCSLCSKKYPRPSNLKKHITTKHSGFYCDKCDGLAFSSRSELNDHLRTHSDCSMCGKTFVNPLNLKKHITNKHSEFYCDKCDGLAFSLRSELNDHLLTHSEQSKSVRPEEQGPKLSASKCTQSIKSPSEAAGECFKCSMCGNRFSHPSNLKKHITLVHSGFYCDKCDGLAFSSRSDLNKHVLTHSEQSKSVRPEEQGPKLSAPKGKTMSSSAKEPKSVQSGERKGKTKSLSAKKPKSVQSGECKESNKSSPAKELKSVHSERSTKRNVKSSSRTKDSNQLQSGQPNVADKRFYCNLCGKGFSRPSRLKKHMDIHSDDFICIKCDDLSFPSSAELELHMLTHAVKLKCPKCYGTFASQSKLEEHMTSHPNPVSHICDVCSFAFGSQKSLDKHKTMYHFTKR